MPSRRQIATGYRRGLRSPYRSSAPAGFIAPDASNLRGHWTGESVVLTSSRISEATDLSGQANHLTQATAGRRPVVSSRSAGGTARDAIHFRTANTEWLRDSGFTAPVSQPLTVYALFEMTVLSPATSILFDDGGTAEVAFYYSTGSFRGASGAILNSGVTTQTGVYGLCAVHNGASSAIYLNDFGTAAASGNMGTNAMGSLTLGANTAGAGPMDGYVWRMLVYSGAHDATARNQVRDQINSYYGTSIA